MTNEDHSDAAEPVGGNLGGEPNGSIDARGDNGDGFEVGEFIIDYSTGIGFGRLENNQG